MPLKAGYMGFPGSIPFRHCPDLYLLSFNKMTVYHLHLDHALEPTAVPLLKPQPNSNAPSTSSYVIWP